MKNEKLEKQASSEIARIQKIANASAQGGYDKGWNACLDAVQRIAIDDDNPHRSIALAERLEGLRK